MEIDNGVNNEQDLNSVTCRYCKSEGIDKALNFCPNCGYPLAGTDQEIKKFMVRKHRQKIDLEKGNKAVKTARIMLYILSGLNFIIGLIIYAAIDDEFVILLAGLVGALIYFGLAVWSKTNPFPAILSGFFVYLIFIALNAVADPETLYRGIIIKVLIIIGFIYGIQGAKESERIKKELDSEKTMIKFEK